MGERIQLSGLQALVASIFSIALVLAVVPAHAADNGKTKEAAQVPWNKVPGGEQRILAPLSKDWNQLPGTQQRRLITSARQYPKLAPIQQERFQDRLTEWAALTPQQRAAAREKYQNLSKLPPAKQHELREKWIEKKAASTLEPAPVPAPPPVSATSK